MHRRDVLTAGVSVSTVFAAGSSTERIDDGTSDDTVLEAPENDLPDDAEFPYPTCGDSFPTIELRDSLAETVVNTDAIEDDCLVCTAFYAAWPTRCIPPMVATSEAQAESIERGIDGSVRFLAIMFDPKRDTADEPRNHAETVDADLENGNWDYLRPADATEAKSVVEATA